jgi:hypothetical protein
MRLLRPLCLVLAFVFALGAAPVDAQPSPKIYVHAGGVLPQGPDQFSEFYGPGPHLGGGVGLDFASNNLEIILAVRYNRFSTDDDGIVRFLEGRVGPLPDNASVTVDAEATRILGGVVNFKFSSQLVPRVLFYFSGGLGLYHRDLYDVQVTASLDGTTDMVDFSTESKAESVTDPGINFGLGVSAAVGPSIEVYLEPHYTLIFSNTEDDIFFFPVQIGTSFTF